MTKYRDCELYAMEQRPTGYWMAEVYRWGGYLGCTTMRSTSRAATVEAQGMVDRHLDGDSMPIVWGV